MDDGINGESQAYCQAYAKMGIQDWSENFPVFVQGPMPDKQAYNIDNQNDETADTDREIGEPEAEVNQNGGFAGPGKSNAVETQMEGNCDSEKHHGQGDKSEHRGFIGGDSDTEDRTQEEVADGHGEGDEAEDGFIFGVQHYVRADKDESGVREGHGESFNCGRGGEPQVIDKGEEEK